MPWNEVTKMDERVRLVGDHSSGLYTVTELVERHGISRKTGYKWIGRYGEEGVEGLRDRSCAPHSCPHQTPEWIERRVLEAREAHPRWGPKKLLAVLKKAEPELAWPVTSTVGAILKRHGLIEGRERRYRHVHPGRPVVEAIEPNDVWSSDFKGQFRLGNREYCYPLTVLDGVSRYLVGCQGRSSVCERGAREVFERLFEEYGLPWQMLTDNGTPFSSPGLCGLSRLSVWWIKLGIQPLRIERGHPEQNGRHERMHSTLKAETTRPPGGSMRAQQRTFDRFRREYNEERPHEALDQRPPGSVYRPSERRYPRREPSVEYPGHYEVRRVKHSGEIRWQGENKFLTRALAGEWVGLEEIEDGIWSLYFSRVELCRIDERSKPRGS